MAEKKPTFTMPSFYELDDYEQSLCESLDPADHTALLIRLVLKQAGVDPDSDNWWITGQKMESSDPNLIIEEQKIHYKPRIVNPHRLEASEHNFMMGNVRGELKLMSIDWGTGVTMGAGAPKECEICEGKEPDFVPDPEFIGGVVMATEKESPFVDDHLEALIKLASDEINVDPDRYMASAMSAFRRWEKSYPHVLKHMTHEKMVTWFLIAINQLRHTEEQRRIAKSVRDDADTASMEELEAASNIYDKVTGKQVDEAISLLSLVIEPDHMPKEEQIAKLTEVELEDIMCWAAGVHVEASDNALEKPMGAAPPALRDLLPKESHYKYWRIDKNDRLYDENFYGLFVNTKTGKAHMLHIGWYSASSYVNYWYVDCGPSIDYAGGDSMTDKGCHGPGENWIDIRDFEGEYEVCKSCQRHKRYKEWKEHHDANHD